MNTVRTSQDFLRQIPDSAIERALLERVIESSHLFSRRDIPIAGSPRTAYARLTGEWDTEGRAIAQLVIEPAEFSFATALDVESLLLHVWVAEREYPATVRQRVVVWWEMPANTYTLGRPQDNDAGWLPVLSQPKEVTA